MSTPIAARSRSVRVREADTRPQADALWLGYNAGTLRDGFYAAESTNDERTTYFEVRGAGVGWFGHDDKQVVRRMKRSI